MFGSCVAAPYSLYETSFLSPLSLLFLYNEVFPIPFDNSAVYYGMTLTGRCLCGAIVYVSESTDLGLNVLCHCVDCQKACIQTEKRQLPLIARWWTLFN